ncbi:hypothetical protein ABZ319_29620 [Nocardia sp. NPDC005978]|uniref:hypothetical protein n=1 Tax=Nocardia sp. NPDC005978 TaxID=3156725 RepID=UPI0033AF0A08
MNETGSTLPRRQLGRYLFEWRTRTGMTRTKAAQLLDMGASSLQPPFVILGYESPR